MHAEELAEVISDLDATVAYIDDKVTQQAETLDFEQAVALRDACARVSKEALDAVSLIETTMLAHLETGVRQLGTRLFKRKHVTVKRFRHDLIAAAVGKYARVRATDENGVTSVTQAVDHTLMAMRSLYVSPSTPAKVGALDSLGIERKDVTEYEDKGFRVEIEELDDRQD